ncbi:MAG: hypothetical protein V3R99_11980, partial [Thermoguttaceae bacterium]
AVVGGNIYVGSLSGLRKIEVFDRSGEFLRNMAIAFPVSALHGDHDRNSAVTETIVNGGFEARDFSAWNALSNGLPELTPWAVGSAGGGFFYDSSPRSGSYSAYNGFDGEAGLKYELYQDVTIPVGVIKATLRTNHRIVASGSGMGTADRILEISVRDTANAVLESLYTQRISPELRPPTDLGWNTQFFDLSAYAGQTVRIHFAETIPDTHAGPALIELDDISLLVEPMREEVLPDVDAYTFDLTGKTAGPIDVILTGQDGVDFSGEMLELLDTDGVTVLATASPAPLGVSATNYDLAILDFVVPGDGIYTLRLTSSVGGRYGIVVTDRVMFESEPNAQIGGPLRTLASPGEAIGYLEADTPLLFVAEWQSPTSSTIHTVDPLTGSILNSFPVPASLTDRAVKLNLAFDGNRLFCSTGDEGTAIYVLDARDGTVLEDFTATATVFGVGLGYARGELFVADHGQGDVDVYDAQSFAYLRSFDAPQMPLTGLSGDDANRLLYAVDYTTHTLLKMDPATGAVLDSAPAGPGNLWGTAVLGDEVFVTESGGQGSPVQNVVVYDASTLEEVRRFAMPVNTSIAGLGGDGVSAAFFPGDAFFPEDAGPVAAADVDRYELHLNAGEVIILLTQTPLDHPLRLPGNNLDPKMSILDVDGLVIAADTDSAPDGKNSLIRFVAPEGDTYIVEVAAESGRGEYRLTVAGSQVVGRQVFYNNSSFDDNDPQPSAADDAAIATDKTALRPGEKATSAN